MRHIYYLPECAPLGSGTASFKMVKQVSEIVAPQWQEIEIYTEEARRWAETFDWRTAVVKGVNSCYLPKVDVEAAFASAGFTAPALFDGGKIDISKHAAVRTMYRYKKSGQPIAKKKLAQKVISPHKARDAFFTKHEIAVRCMDAFHKQCALLGLDKESLTYIEPSAGAGAFYDLMPPDRRIGLDICPMADGIIETDFLKWRPSDARQMVAVGNPPFGKRGATALSFLNRAGIFCIAAGLILPWSFGRVANKSPARRVRTLSLVHSEELPPDAFRWPDGRSAGRIPCVFQVWHRR